MVCSGGYCSSQCYSYGCSAAHRSSCGSNAYDLGSLGSGPTLEMMNKLRTAIATERSKRNSHSKLSVPVLGGSDKVSGDLVNASDLNELVTCINYMVSNSYDNTSSNVGGSYAAGSLLAQPDFENIRTKITELAVDCICNSDCGANARCSCYHDCGCNYSDERLKTDITYI